MRTLFDFAGRASRLTYWRVFLLSSVVGSVVFIMGCTAIIHFGPVGGVLFVGLVPPLVFSAAVGIRRAHDRGKAAVWFWIFTLGPFSLNVIAESLPARAAGGGLVTLALMLGSIVIYIWGIVELGFLRGAPVPNVYGAPELIR